MAPYDFIIVGAGSAGCVLAERLTASGRYRVLIIEAGGSDNRAWIKVPLGYGKTFADPSVNWCYTASADPGLNQRCNYWPRGKVVGGSSSINALAYVRGLPHDFDDWERAGAIGWNWETARCTFEALETHVERGNNGQPRLEGEGPVPVTDCSDRMHRFSRHFLQAAREMGWALPSHLNGVDDEGLAYLRSTIKDGRRWSAADAFLHPARKRDNLDVIEGALARRIVLDGRRAIGVEYERMGRSQTALAGRDVILSAGAVNSPQLLQLSGIGGGALLQGLGVTVHQPLEQVGKGLQDHLAISHYFRATEPTLNNRIGNWKGKVAAGIEYFMTRRGPLSVPINQVGGFVRTDPDRPANMQIYCNPMSYKVTEAGAAEIDPEAGFLLCAQPCRPTSRGEVAIVSSDPRVAPAIRPNSLSTDCDRAQAIRAGRLLERLSATPAIRAVTKARLAPQQSDLSDDERLEDYRARASSVFHASCTCRMGQGAMDSVVDPRLKVHGIGGLRVVDASAFPNVTSGNTNAPVMMLAARAAEIILEDAARPPRPEVQSAEHRPVDAERPLPHLETES